MYIFVPVCVEDFLFVSPLQLRTTREAAKFAVAGAVIGAVSTAAVSWKYSRSPHGKFPSSFPMLVHKCSTIICCRGVFGVTFGQEFASHWLQLYRLDTLGAEVKFLEWWERKIGGRS
ncbi:Succinate dehydrogenase subunit 6, mitochondrial [Vitis vinifera]|uniref:Succinate dehydrogenase subunit 6, mitochondrial n=1 Tax=Vitis vinifera TaxID=29760 RepID=A0A438KDG4_VITVI|nr:Succinate dehydrogenase subunit 6, mitochondrial [Vitis vinifera]